MVRSIMKREHLQFSGVSFEDYFDGLYQMNRAVKWLDLKDLVNNDLPPVYMFQASTEEENLKKDQLSFWNLMKDNKSRRSLVTFDGAHHVIVYSSPKESVEMTVKVVEGKLTKNSYLINANK